MRVNLAEHGTKITCESCGNGTFAEQLHIFRVSKLITGAPEDAYIPMKTFACAKCGHINKEFSMDSEEKTSFEDI
jgi:hypothetical protein